MESDVPTPVTTTVLLPTPSYMSMNKPFPTDIVAPLRTVSVLSLFFEPTRNSPVVMSELSRIIAWCPG